MKLETSNFHYYSLHLVFFDAKRKKLSVQDFYAVKVRRIFFFFCWRKSKWPFLPKQTLHNDLKTKKNETKKGKETSQRFTNASFISPLHQTTHSYKKSRREFFFSQNFNFCHMLRRCFSLWNMFDCIFCPC